MTGGTLIQEGVHKKSILCIRPCGLSSQSPAGVQQIFPSTCTRVATIQLCLAAVFTGAPHRASEGICTQPVGRRQPVSTRPLPHESRAAARQPPLQGKTGGLIRARKPRHTAAGRDERLYRRRARCTAASYRRPGAWYTVLGGVYTQHLNTVSCVYTHQYTRRVVLTTMNTGTGTR
jgi:hypothetical protein